MSVADIVLVRRKRAILEKIYREQLSIKKADRRKDLPAIKTKLFIFNRWLTSLKNLKS